MYRGSCLCGAVTYRVEGEMSDVHACHCSQCRKQSGHFVAAATAKRDCVTIEGEENLTWYSASPGTGRGFCRTCGSHLFWKQEGWDGLSINLGALEGETGLSLSHHIFCADKGDYYEIDDSLPHYDAYAGD